MIKINSKIWIGDSDDERVAYKIEGDTAVLNVAQDLETTLGWTDGIEHMHVGLIDGPGNTPAAYAAAILALAVLLERSDTILVCCHNAGRSLAVVLMYLIIKAGKNSDHPTFLNYWTSWDKMLEKISKQVPSKLPEIHKAHKEVFDKMPLSLIEVLI